MFEKGIILCERIYSFIEISVRKLTKAIVLIDFPVTIVVKAISRHHKVYVRCTRVVVLNVI